MRRHCGLFSVALLLAAAANPLSARNRIAYIEFFGYQGIDVNAVRQALPFRDGDNLSGDLQEQAHAAVKRVTGRDATDVFRVCCTGDADSVVFIGLPGSSSRAFRLDSAPQGDAAVSAELAALSHQANEAEMKAVMSGHSAEDGAPGYRLLKEPGAKSAELAVRDYVLQHEDEIIRVLQSSAKANQRAMAADALGYAARQPRQLVALTRAVRDPDSDVRNNATRALGEILRADPSAADQIPPDAFIDMVRSGTWTDRNKGCMTLWPLTQARDKELLARVQSEAGEALWEIARWHSVGWAFCARSILGRIAGVPEDRLNTLALGPFEAFAAALGR
jgi:hypothetical protein